MYEIVYCLVDKVGHAFQVLRFRPLLIPEFLFRVFGGKRCREQVTAHCLMDYLPRALLLLLQSD